jgi:putative DNA primase/helicase
LARSTGARSTVTDATSEYRADQDVLQHFVDARCKTGASQRVKGSALYASYKQWAEIAGEFIMSDRDFGNAMSDRGYSRYHTKVERGWDGIALTAADDETVDETMEDSREVAEALD